MKMPAPPGRRDIGTSRNFVLWMCTWLLAAGCSSQPPTNLDEWVVLVGNIDDQQIVLRVPPGKSYMRERTRSFSTDSLDESRVLFKVLYGRGGGFANKPYPLDIAIILEAVVENGSGSSISGLTDSIRKEMSGHKSPYEMKVETLDDREWVAVSGEHGGTYATPFSEGYYLSVFYSFDRNIGPNSKWRRDWETVIKDIARSTSISGVTTVR